MRTEQSTIPRKNIQPLAFMALFLCLLGQVSGDPPERPPHEGEQNARPGKPSERPPHGRDGMPMKRMFEEVDANGDQSVSFEEFSRGKRVSRLSEEQQKRLFERLDRNKDGALDKEDAPPRSERSRGLPFRGDADGNGEISFEEFAQSPRMVGKPEDVQQTLFDRMDRNKDGVLSKDDWKGRRGPGGPRGRGGPPPFHADADGDGKVSLEEFRNHPRHKKQTEDEQEDLFKKLDKNGDGFLDESERPARPGGPPEKRMKPGKKKKDREGRDKEGA